MPVVIVGIVTTLITIGTTIYTIAKTVYDWIIKPLTYVKNVIDKVRDIIRSTIDLIRGKIDYVLKITGVDMLLDLTHSVAEFIELVEDIANGNNEALIKALGGVYEAIAGTANDIIHFVSESLSPIFDRLAILKRDINTINKFKLKDITDSISKVVEYVKKMPEELMFEINAEIKEESQRIRDGFAGELAIVDARLTDIISLSKDLEYFTRMFLKVMET